MKMSEVFELPLVTGHEDEAHSIGDGNYWLADFDDMLTYEDEKGPERARAAAHAINNYDSMKEALEVALEWVRCGIGGNCSGYPKEHKDYLMVLEALNKANSTKQSKQHRG